MKIDEIFKEIELICIDLSVTKYEGQLVQHDINYYELKNRLKQLKASLNKRENQVGKKTKI